MNRATFIEKLTEVQIEKLIAQLQASEADRFAAHLSWCQLVPIKAACIFEFKINPEVNTRLEAFMKAEPGMVQFVKQLPREQLERKFLLRKMQDQEQKQGYSAKVKAWLNKPEQADLVKSIKAAISPNMRPEKQEQAILTQVKNCIRTTGIKLS
jgi:hypothetical protein